MITLDYSVLIQIIFFLILWYLLSRLLFKPYLTLLEEREKRTSGTKSDTVALTEEAERLRADYENKIAQVREQAEAAKEAIVDEGRRAREQLLERARVEAAKMLQAAREEIQRQLQEGRATAVREAQAFARQMAEKILGRRVA